MNYVKYPYSKIKENTKIILNDEYYPYKAFGKEIKRTGKVRHHIHIKINDECNGNCIFCVERGKNIDYEFNLKYLKRLENILDDFQKNNLIYSVSITGGEPLLAKHLYDVLDIIFKYNFKVVTINTNAYFLKNNIDKLSKYDIYSINISRHHYDEDKNNEIFKFRKVFTNDELVNMIREYRSKNNKTRFRLQCVLMKDYINSLSELDKFIKVFAADIDDFSFRQQITVDENFDPSIVEFYKHNFLSIDDILSEIYESSNYELIRQKYEYYYEYESWHNKELDKDINFAFSNMSVIKRLEETEDDNIMREFIYFKDGRLAGSWYNGFKTILESIGEDDDI